MEPKDGFVEANGIRLHYTEWGGDAPPLVLLHATGFLARLWQPIAVQLSARFHVYALDARGHGDSDKPAPSGGYGWEGLAADLMGFLDSLGLVGVPIIGHSSGAAGAARLAAKRRMVWDSREELITAYRQRRTFAGWRKDVLRLFAEHGTFEREDGRIELKCPGEIEAELYRNSLSPDTWDLLPHVGCPTLVIRGENTEPMLALVAEGVARRIPGARLATIAGGSHFVPMERPEAIAAEALAFLEGAVPVA